MKNKIKKIILVSVFCFLPIIAKSQSLENILGISKLENFSKIKNIEIEKILITVYLNLYFTKGAFSEFIVKKFKCIFCLILVFF